MTEVADVKMIDTQSIDHWKQNPRPRTRRDAAKDAELVESVRKDGILQSLVLRPNAAKDGRFLIVCGERRFDAAVAVGLAAVPAAVRDLSDVDALAIAMTENIQRADMHPLDEAVGLERMIKLDATLKAPDALANRLGLSAAHVRRRLKLLKLTPAARAAFSADALGVQHVDVLAGLDPKMQQLALEDACYYEIFGDVVRRAIKDEAFEQLRDAIVPIGTLREWVRDKTVADLKSPEVQESLGEEFKAAIAETPLGAGGLLRVSDVSYNTPTGLLGRGAWRDAGVEACAHRERAVVVHGGPTRLTYACRNAKCETHYPENRPAPAREPVDESKLPKAERDRLAQERSDRARDAQWRKIKRFAWAALIKAIGGKVKLSARLVRDVLSVPAVKDAEEKTGVKLTDATAAIVLLVHALGRDDYSATSFARAARPYGFDVAKWTREFVKATDKAKAAAKGKPAGGAKKPAKKSGATPAKAAK